MYPCKKKKIIILKFKRKENFSSSYIQTEFEVKVEVHGQKKCLYIGNSVSKSIWSKRVKKQEIRTVSAKQNKTY